MLQMVASEEVAHVTLDVGWLSPGSGGKWTLVVRMQRAKAREFFEKVGEVPPEPGGRRGEFWCFP